MPRTPDPTDAPRSLVQQLIDSRAATGPGPVPPPGASSSSASTTGQDNRPPTAEEDAC
ncbi:hypothetical protein [Streptomyces sp. NPDC020983]|uniref:hypothetical protein n=1 Tax=Streptomyces sp. NPDC020983 TaxID=3365106 RepID=UPI00378B11DC